MKISRWFKIRLPAGFVDKMRQFIPLLQRAFWFGSGKKQNVFSSYSNVMKFLFILLCGIGSGEYLWHKWHYCVEINSDHSPFYGQFAQLLKNELGKLGYSFTCPAYIPKTAIRFIYTNKYKYVYPAPEKKHGITNIGIVGDCFESTDLNYIYKYDFLLMTLPYHTGYLSGMGYRVANFKLPDNNDMLLCDTYKQLSENDIHQAGIWLDNIIQRTRHD